MKIYRNIVTNGSSIARKILCFLVAGAFVFSCVFPVDIKSAWALAPESAFRVNAIQSGEPKPGVLSDINLLATAVSIFQFMVRDGVKPDQVERRLRHQFAGQEIIKSFSKFKLSAISVDLLKKIVNIPLENGLILRIFSTDTPRDLVALNAGETLVSEATADALVIQVLRFGEAPSRSGGFSGLPNEFYSKSIKAALEAGNFAAISLNFENGVLEPRELETDDRKMIKGNVELTQDELKVLAIAKDMLSDEQIDLLFEASLLFIPGLDESISKEVSGIAAKAGSAPPVSCYGTHYGIQRNQYYFDRSMLKDPDQLFSHLSHELNERDFVRSRISQADAGLAAKDRTSSLSNTIIQLASQAHEALVKDEIKTGTVVDGKWVVESIITGGGMSNAYLARPEAGGDKVVLKIFNTTRSGIRRVWARRMFIETEIPATKRLDHPNIARYVSDGSWRGVPYLVTKYEEGLLLQKIIDDNTPLSENDVVNYAIQLLKAIDHMSSKGVVHRDVKPGNIIITNDGRAVLFDLGIAALDGKDDISKSAYKIFLGTVDYTPPEQHASEAIYSGMDQRSDIYSLGCTLYNALTGKEVFADTGSGYRERILNKHKSRERPRIRQTCPDRNFNRKLDEIIYKMIQAERGERYQTADECLKEFEDLARQLRDELSAGSESQIDDKASGEPEFGLIGHRISMEKEQYRDWLTLELSKYFQKEQAERLPMLLRDDREMAIKCFTSSIVRLRPGSKKRLEAEGYIPTADLSNAIDKNSHDADIVMLAGILTKFLTKYDENSVTLKLQLKLLRTLTPYDRIIEAMRRYNIGMSFARRAYISNPAQPEKFIEKVNSDIPRLMEKYGIERGQAYNAAIGHPADTDSYLDKVIIDVQRLMAKYDIERGLAMQAAANYPSDPDKFIMKVLSEVDRIMKAYDIERGLALHAASKYSDPDAFIIKVTSEASRLREKYGVDPWVAQYVLVHSSGDPDLFLENAINVVIPRLMKEYGVTKSAAQYAAVRYHGDPDAYLKTGIAQGKIRAIIQQPESMAIARRSEKSLRDNKRLKKLGFGKSGLPADGEKQGYENWLTFRISQYFRGKTFEPAPRTFEASRTAAIETFVSGLLRMREGTIRRLERDGFLPDINVYDALRSNSRDIKISLLGDSLIRFLKKYDERSVLPKTQLKLLSDLTPYEYVEDLAALYKVDEGVALRAYMFQPKDPEAFLKKFTAKPGISSRGVSGFENEIYSPVIRKAIEEGRYSSVVFNSHLGIFDNGILEPIDGKFGTGILRLDDEQLKVLNEANLSLPSEVRILFKGSTIIFIEGLDDAVANEVSLRSAKDGRAPPVGCYGTHYGIQRNQFYIDTKYLSDPKELARHLHHEVRERDSVLDGLTEEESGIPASQRPEYLSRIIDYLSLNVHIRLVLRDISPGDVIDNRWKIIDVIGRGAMAVVDSATDLETGKMVAIKFLNPYTGDDDMGINMQIRRFLEVEIPAAKRLHHPNIPKYVGSGSLYGVPYLVTEDIEGVLLWGKMIGSNGRLPQKEAINYTIQLLRALENAATNGVVHRDIKPENVIITPDGRAVLIDFGLGVLDGVDKITADGFIVGTDNYMSPEQIKGDRRFDSRTDIYSLGCMLHRLVTGVYPFSGSDVLKQHGYAIRPSMLNVAPDLDIDPELDKIVIKMMQIRPQDRYKSPTACLRDLVTLAGKLGVKVPEAPAITGVSSGVIEDISKDLHFINNTLTPVIPEGKILWHVIPAELVPDSIRAKFIETITEMNRVPGIREKIKVVTDRQDIADEIVKLLRDPANIVDAAVGTPDALKNLPQGIKALVFEGETGDFRQLEGIIAALRALYKNDAATLVKLYEILTGSKFPGATTDLQTKFANPEALAKLIKFTLKPIIQIPQDELKRLNEAMLGMLRSA